MIWTKTVVLLLHEVMHIRVDPLNDGHQIIKNVFCVVHGRIHEVPEKKRTKRRAFLEPPSTVVEGGRQGGKGYFLF